MQQQQQPVVDIQQSYFQQQKNDLFIRQRFQTLQNTYQTLTAIIADVHVYNVSNYVFFQSNGKKVDTFHFDIILLHKFQRWFHHEIQFTVSFQQKRNDVLKIIPFVFINGYKMQLTDKKDNTFIKFFVKAGDYATMISIFNKFWS